MTDFHDKPYHSKSDLLGDPNKPQEGSRKTSFAFVSDIYIGDRRLGRAIWGRGNSKTKKGRDLNDTAF